ncbi:MAG: hypothetical protein HC910_22530 [Spirulinaceae cyanobacterium SM2_1_0]|nr:hypothetical protein [Spirulinaceae cyanobacterium SM2_1_0]
MAFLKFERHYTALHCSDGAWREVMPLPGTRLEILEGYLQQLSAEIARAEEFNFHRDFASLYVNNPKVRSVADRILELHQCKPDWFDPLTIYRLLLIDPDEDGKPRAGLFVRLNGMDSDSKPRSKEVAASESVAKLITQLVALELFENVQQATDFVSLQPLDFVISIRNARLLELDPKYEQKAAEAEEQAEWDKRAIADVFRKMDERAGIRPPKP